MHILQWIVRGALACTIAATTAVAAAAQQAPLSQPTLRQAADGHLLVGAAVMSDQLGRPELAKLVAQQFNCLTCENEMKPDQLQGTKGDFTFERADKVVAFAQANKMKVVGHTLCWHHQSPRWMFADENQHPLPREQALANLKQHITTVMQHYKGQVIGWDVVNEALGDSEPYLRATPARKAIGDDFVIKAFQFAHDADPDAQLYYNDYNIESPYKRDKGLRLIRELKAAGVRIDAVGIQGHWLIDTPLSEIENAINAYAAEGVKVNFTEVDVDPLPRAKGGGGGGGGADLSATEKQGLNPYPQSLPLELQQRLAKRYGDLFKLFAKHRDVIARITFWGVDDGSSWLNNWPVRGRTNHPLLWDRQLQPKPALNAVIDALREFDQSLPATRE
jgi:endo-1,4-beta-xylanase